MWARRVAPTVVLIPTPRCRPHRNPAHSEIQIGMTPLHYAISDGELGCAERLITAKADIDIQDEVMRYAGVRVWARLRVVYGMDVSMHESVWK